MVGRVLAGLVQGKRVAALAVLLMVSLVVLPSRPGGVAAAGPFDVTGLYQIRFVLPDTVLGFEVHANCLMRIEQTEAGPVDTVTARASCYQVATTDPNVPPPPPPPYNEFVFPTLVTMSGQVDAAGALTLQNDGCIVVPTGQPPQPTGMTFNISATAAKGGGIVSGTVDLVLDNVDPLVCDEPADISQPFTHTSLPLSHDADIWADGQVAPDGCTTWEELGTDPSTGGLRDPWNWWDFFDPNLDGNITLDDIFAVIDRFGAGGDPTVDPLSSPPASGYHPRFDRGATLGPDGWNIDAPEGSITLDDIFAVIAQFGHSCAGPPN